MLGYFIAKNSTLFFTSTFLVLVLNACSTPLEEESVPKESSHLNSPFLPLNDDVLESGYEAYCLDPSHYASLVPFKTNIRKGNISIELLFERYWDYLRPAIVSRNAFGEEIDRKWIMGEDFCYNGTDSGKNPLLKIEKSGRVSFSETDCYTDYGSWEMIDSKNLTVKSEMYCWTHTCLYQIQSNGLIDFVRKDTERWEE